MADEESTEHRKRKRWGDSAPLTTNGSEEKHNDSSSRTKSKEDDAKAKAAALQQSISARLAALKAKKVAQEVPVSSAGDEPATKKAKLYDIDLSVVAPTFKQELITNQQPSQKKSNPYLAHVDNSDDLNSNISTIMPDEGMLLDSRLAGGHVVKPRERRELRFVEPGSYIHKAERKRAKIENAAKAGFLSGRKIGTFVKSTGIANPVVEDQEGEGSDYYGGGSSSMDDLLMQDQSIDYLVKKVPRADSVEEGLDGSTKSTGGVQVIPVPIVIEWWDVELLPSKLKKEVVAIEGKAVNMRANQRMKSWKKKTINASDDHFTSEEPEDDENIRILSKQIIDEANISCSKTYKLVQHPIPVIPPNAPKEAPVPTLHLTKKELKRQRKLRRAEKQRELQDMQAAGLIPAPEPRLTLANFMRVLGEQAVVDPSKMEAKVLEQIQARKLKHDNMNAERKLTKEQRSAKMTKKLTEDTIDAVNVALFLVKDMSHRYHRTKVDLNAQQFKITGGVLECARPMFNLVICEGGPKAIQRFTRLMLVRMKWKGEIESNVDDMDEEEVVDAEGNTTEKPQKFNPDNSCELVWTGLAPKRIFNSFVFQACESADIARKVLEAKGIAHYWDQVVTHYSGTGETFNFHLGNTTFKTEQEIEDMEE